MMAIAPTLGIYESLISKHKALDNVWCGAIVLSMLRQCEKPINQIRQYSSHTFFL